MCTGITKGDTPETNPLSKLLAGWIEEWLASPAAEAAHRDICQENGGLRQGPMDEIAMAIGCVWCGGPITRRLDGGRQRRFCLPAHRTAYYSAARRLVDGLVSSGRLSADALHASPATLVPGAFVGGSATPP
jgi:hypothetical protein